MYRNMFSCVYITISMLYPYPKIFRNAVFRIYIVSISESIPVSMQPRFNLSENKHQNVLENQVLLCRQRAPI